MRPAGNLAGVEFIDAPQYLRHETRETWRLIISESGYFFTKAAMKWFSSRVAWDTLTQYRDGYLFITSEQDKPVYISSGMVPAAWDGQRRYTLRYFTLENGLANDLGVHSEHGRYETLERARRVLQQLVKGAGQ